MAMAAAAAAGTATTLAAAAAAGGAGVAGAAGEAGVASAAPPGAAPPGAPPITAPGAPPSFAVQLDWREVALAVLLCLLIAVTVVGNTLIIAAVVSTRRLRTVTNCFVMSLAVADWLVGLFVMPPKVMKQLMGRWELGPVLCEVWVSLDILLCTASILSLCAISVDRYLAVTQPLHYSRRRRSKRLALAMICAVWLLAFCITCPPLFFFAESQNESLQPQSQECTYLTNPGYVVFSAMGSFFLPLLIMLYVYARISCVIASRHSQLTALDRTTTQRSSHAGSAREESDGEHASSDCEDNPAGPDHCPRRTSSWWREAASAGGAGAGAAADGLAGEAASRVSSFRRESKTAQTLAIVVGGFVACWLPFFTSYILGPFVGPIDAFIVDILIWLGWINSAINPFIYAFYSPDFRIALWRLTFRQCSGRRRPADPSLRRK